MLSNINHQGKRKQSDNDSVTSHSPGRLWPRDRQVPPRCGGLGPHTLPLDARSCLTLWPTECSLPNSSVPGVFQARTLEQLVTSYFRGLPTQGSDPHLLCLLHWQGGSWPPARSRKLHARLAENKLRRQSLWESLVAPQKVKHRITIWHSNSTHNYIPKRNENTCLHKKLNNFKILPFIKPK